MNITESFNHILNSSGGSTGVPDSPPRPQLIAKSKYKMIYDTKKSFDNDVGARTFGSDKSAPHFTSFLIDSESTIKRPVYFKFSQQFQLPKHRFKLRKNATFSDLVFKIFLAVPTSKTSFHIAVECTVTRRRFPNVLTSSSFQNIVSKCFSAVLTSEPIALKCNS